MSERMNIVIIVCDALRYDHLAPKYMPNLSKITQTGCLFTWCLSIGGNTKTSIPGIICSKREYDKNHNLPSILKSKGYTPGIIHSNPLLNQFLTGFELKKDLYKEKAPLTITARQILKKVGIWQRTRGVRRSLVGNKTHEMPYRRAQNLLKSAEIWMENQPEPWFLWIQLMDTHYPYLPLGYDKLSPKEMWALNDKLHDSIFRNYTITEKESKEIKLLYEAEVQYMDQWLGKFLLTQFRRRPKTLIIITSDHGDEFGEYGFYSHAPGKHGPIPQLLHVPLIFFGLDVKPQIINKYVSTLDIAPTILDYAKIEEKIGYGRSLKPLLIGGAG